MSRSRTQEPLPPTKRLSPVLILVLHAHLPAQDETMPRFAEVSRQLPEPKRPAAPLRPGAAEEDRLGPGLVALRQTAGSHSAPGVGLLADLAELELSEGRIREASNRARKIMRINPLAPVGPFLMAVYVRLGKTEQAREQEEKMKSLE